MSCDLLVQRNPRDFTSKSFMSTVNLQIVIAPYCQATGSPYCSPPAWEYAGPPRYGSAYRQTVAVIDEATQAVPPVSPFILRYGIRANKTPVFDKPPVSVSPSRSCRALSYNDLLSDIAMAVMAFRRVILPDLHTDIKKSRYKSDSGQQLHAALSPINDFQYIKME